jgi:hypothetical protein
LRRIYFYEIDQRGKKTKKKKILKSLGLHGQGEITGRRKYKVETETGLNSFPFFQTPLTPTERANVCLGRAGEKFSRAIIIDVESEASVEETFDVVRILLATFLSFSSGLASEG